MGGDTIKQQGTGESVKSLARWLPNLMQATGGAVGPYEQQLFNARAGTDPQNSALDLSLAKYFLPQFSQVGSDVQRQEALNTSQTEGDVLGGPGGRTALMTNELNKQIDPEYYSTRAAGADKLKQLLAGQDPNQLTGAEMANTERSLNRTNYRNGQQDVRSSQGAIGNAMTFGSALDTKRNTLLNTINAVPQNLAAMKSGTDAFQIATGRPQYGANPAQGQFTNSRQGFGSNVQGMSGQLLGEAGQNVRQTQNLIANKRDSLDRVTQVMGSLPSC